MKKGPFNKKNHPNNETPSSKCVVRTKIKKKQQNIGLMKSLRVPFLTFQYWCNQGDLYFGQNRALNHKIWSSISSLFVPDSEQMSPRQRVDSVFAISSSSMNRIGRGVLLLQFIISKTHFGTLNLTLFLLEKRTTFWLDCIVSLKVLLAVMVSSTNRSPFTDSVRIDAPP